MRFQSSPRPGSLIVADNATSHPAEIARFVALVKFDREFVVSFSW